MKPIPLIYFILISIFHRLTFAIQQKTNQKDMSVTPPLSESRVKSKIFNLISVGGKDHSWIPISDDHQGSLQGFKQVLPPWRHSKGPRSELRLLNKDKLHSFVYFLDNIFEMDSIKDSVPKAMSLLTNMLGLAGAVGDILGYNEFILLLALPIAFFFTFGVILLWPVIPMLMQMQ